MSNTEPSKVQMEFRGRGGETFFPGCDRNNVLVVTRGHHFDRNGFYEMFEHNPEIEWSGVEHPAAQLMFNPETARHFDCYVLYDMPGVQFKRYGDGVPRFHEPPAFYKEGMLAMMDAGVPLVVMHHACAAWPAWPEWAEIVGGAFLYQPGYLRGEAKPDSGYRMNVRHRISPEIEHPVTEGIHSFEIEDELYLYEVFDDSVIPLLSSDFEFSQDNFFSARAALAGEFNSNRDWEHQRGSNLVGWVKTYRNSPIVYLQPGDGPSAYSNPNFRQLLANAIRWACSLEAKSWAKTM